MLLFLLVILLLLVLASLPSFYFISIPKLSKYPHPLSGCFWEFFLCLRGTFLAWCIICVPYFLTLLTAILHPLLAVQVWLLVFWLAADLVCFLFRHRISRAISLLFFEGLTDIPAFLGSTFILVLLYFFVHFIPAYLWLKLLSSVLECSLSLLTSIVYCLILSTPLKVIFLGVVLRILFFLLFEVNLLQLAAARFRGFFCLGTWLIAFCSLGHSGRLLIILATVGFFFLACSPRALSWLVPYLYLCYGLAILLSGYFIVARDILPSMPIAHAGVDSPVPGASSKAGYTPLFQFEIGWTPQSKNIPLDRKLNSGYRWVLGIDNQLYERSVTQPGLVKLWDNNSGVSVPLENYKVSGASYASIKELRYTLKEIVEGEETLHHRLIAAYTVEKSTGSKTCNGQVYLFSSLLPGSPDYLNNYTYGALNKNLFPQLSEAFLEFKNKAPQDHPLHFILPPCGPSPNSWGWIFYSKDSPVVGW
jgi:hypothetical protein